MMVVFWVLLAAVTFLEGSRPGPPQETLVVDYLLFYLEMSRLGGTHLESWSTKQVNSKKDWRL
jgi:hypothetical protein